MDGLSRRVLAGLPLADAVLSVLSWVVEPSFLESVFEEHRGRTYKKALSFDSLVRLIADALLEHGGSGRRAMLQAQERHELEASQQAAYGKLRRIPISLSNGFLARTGDRLREIFPDSAAVRLPASLRAFDVIAVDGKKLKGAAKRLKPARCYAGSPLGGKTLVALDLRRGLAIAMNAHLDGETNDAPLIPNLLPQIRQRSSRRRLWIADRQFCDLTQPVRFAANDEAFLIRYHPKNKFHRDAQRPRREGVDDQGRRYREEWGWLGAPGGKRSLYVRRLTLDRPGHEDVSLVTNLLEADQYPATELLDVYLLRWGIERVFQQVTEVFHLRQLISSSPQGTIFQCALCLLLYNLIQVVRAYVAGAQRRRPETISSEMLFYDVHRELIALDVVIERSVVTNHFHPATSGANLASHLEALLRGVWYERWIKSPKKPPPRTALARKPIKGGHTSIYRILQATNCPRK